MKLKKLYIQKWLKVNKNVDSADVVKIHIYIYI